MNSAEKTDKEKKEEKEKTLAVIKTGEQRGKLATNYIKHEVGGRKSEGLSQLENLWRNKFLVSKSF